MINLKVINFLDSFILSSLAVIVPLFLLERGIDIVSIGLILSFSPLIFLVSRLIFASISDIIGVRKFFMINASAGIVSTLVYLVSTSPASYIVATAAGGVRSASIWAVNRTVVALKVKDKPEEETSKLQGLRSLAAAFGTAVGGMLIYRFGFNWTFVMLTLFGFVPLLVAQSFKGEFMGKVRVREVLRQLDFRKKSGLIKKTSIIMIFDSWGSTALLAFVLPLFLIQHGFDYASIGLAIAVYGIFDAVSTYFFIGRYRIDKLIPIGALLYFFPVLLIPFSPNFLIFPLVALLSIGDAISAIIWEHLVMKAVRRSRSMSSDIGLMHVPSNLATTISLGLAGVIVSSLGYPAIFAMIAASSLLYSYFSLSVLGRNSRM